MTTTERINLLEKIDSAIDSGINYLAQHQLASGEFTTYMSDDLTMQRWCVPESNTGFTAEIGHCLLPFQGNSVVDKMLTKASNYLLYQEIRSGIWQFYAKWHVYFGKNPPDADDTALVCNFLKKRKVNYQDNTKILLLNRNRKGLFYTWFTLHSHFLKYSRQYWRLIARELKVPIKTFVYWHVADHRRNDIDLVINANIIYYLGYNEHTRSAVQHIKEALINSEGLIKDKWYLNEIVQYYFLSRLYELAIPEMIEIKELFSNKIKKAINSHENFNNCDLEIALAASALLRLEVEDEMIETCIQRLLSRQAPNGEWERYGLVNGGPLVWGSEETTTAYSLQALHLYRNHLLKK